MWWRAVLAGALAAAAAFGAQWLVVPAVAGLDPPYWLLVVLLAAVPSVVEESAKRGAMALLDVGWVPTGLVFGAVEGAVRAARVHAAAAEASVGSLALAFAAPVLAHWAFARWADRTGWGLPAAIAAHASANAALVWLVGARPSPDTSPLRGVLVPLALLAASFLLPRRSRPA